MPHHGPYELEEDGVVGPRRRSNRIARAEEEHARPCPLDPLVALAELASESAESRRRELLAHRLRDRVGACFAQHEGDQPTRRVGSRPAAAPGPSEREQHVERVGVQVPLALCTRDLEVRVRLRELEVPHDGRFARRGGAQREVHNAAEDLLPRVVAIRCRDRRSGINQCYVLGERERHRDDREGELRRRGVELVPADRGEHAAHLDAQKLLLLVVVRDLHPVQGPARPIER